MSTQSTHSATDSSKYSTSSSLYYSAIMWVIQTVIHGFNNSQIIIIYCFVFPAFPLSRFTITITIYYSRSPVTVYSLASLNHYSILYTISLWIHALRTSFAAHALCLHPRSHLRSIGALCRSLSHTHTHTPWLTLSCSTHTSESSFIFDSARRLLFSFDLRFVRLLQHSHSRITSNIERD